MNMITTLLKERIHWALTPYPNGIASNVEKTADKTISQLRSIAKAQETEWGNTIIGQTNNGNWTTLLGERLVYDVLMLKGENPRKPETKNGYSPDWETDNFIYEVKTRNWTTSGTAGEKVYGVMYKYSDIPILYEKPLKIVCVAYQEYELVHGNTKIFGEVSNNKKKFLELAKNEMSIEYVKFSDLVKELVID